MKKLLLFSLFAFSLILESCKKEPIETDECDADPTACGCPQEPPSCSDPGNNGGQTISGKVYVSPNGSDANDGSEGKPLKTIQKAADAADPVKGLEIILRGGTYESKEISFRTSNISIHSYPGEWAILKAVTTIEDITSCLWFREPTTENITIENLEIIGGYYYGIKFESNWDDDRNVPFDKRRGVRHIKVKNCKIHDTGRDCIKITPGCQNIEILNCEIYRSGVGPANKEAQNAEGIDNVNGSNMTVRNCYFHDIATNALYAKGGARDCIFEQNLIMNCGEGGLVAGYLDTDAEWFNTASNPNYYESINIIIRNNIVINTKWEGVGLYAALNAQVYNNTLINVAQEGSAALLIARGETYGTPKGDVYPKSKDLKISNNIFVQTASAKGYMARLRWAAEGNIDISNNFYYKPGTLTFRIDKNDDDYNEFDGFTNWKTQSKFDASSTNADPKLDAQYHLTSSSPCIGAGKALGSLVENDYDGGARGAKVDIGADQANNGAALTVPPVVTANGTKGTGGGD
ncbi:right-handed parallel beta-helix repeat-containing protein [Runella sp.]|uniref:right-handed parallel beta-helix repeat-containing protein n=1 Tax=Runella sp. TaxID=1960881 RepID=UPI003D0BDCC3